MGLVTKGTFGPCGHIAMICPQCMHTGCKHTYCEHCIGNTTDAECSVCGGNTMELEQYQDRMRNDNQIEENIDKDVNTRLLALEQSTGVSFNSSKRQSTQYLRPSESSSSLLATIIKVSIVMIVCYVLTKSGLHAENYHGSGKFLISIINILGQLGESILKLILSLFV